jgi:hypothetical protein
MNTTTPDTDASAATPAAEGLEAIVARLRALQTGAEGARRLPPVHLWNPENCGDIGMEIRADGAWWHAGAPIRRQALVDLFATILRKDEDGKTWLVTPGEKIVVHVADAHFLGTRIDRVGEGEDQTLLVTTNGGDVVTLGAEHPLRVEIDPVDGRPRPYVLVRGRLEARLLRQPFLELVNWAEERDGRLVARSGGVAFDLGAP